MSTPFLWHLTRDRASNDYSPTRPCRLRRPGILVLVNDTDWELEGEGDYVLKDGDEIVFISTLHGG